MKIYLLTLPLLLSASVALADDMRAGQPPEEAATTTAQVAMRAKHAMHRVHRHKVKRLPHGDLRYCLARKTNEEIIRCAESPLRH